MHLYADWHFFVILQVKKAWNSAGGTIKWCKTSKAMKKKILTRKQLNQYAESEIIGIKSFHVSYRELEI